MTMKQRLVVLFGAAIMLLFIKTVLADPIQLPNLSKTATGTSLGGGKYALDVSLPPGAVSIGGSQTIGGAYTPGETGLTSLAIRKDAAGPLTGVADGDYTPLLVDSLGQLKVNAALSSPSVSVVESIRNDYTSVPVTTTGWVELIASTAADIKSLEIFDSSGRTLELGIGGAGSEVHLIYVVPGGNGKVDVDIAAGSRVSIQAVSGNAAVGELDINAYSN